MDLLEEQTRRLRRLKRNLQCVRDDLEFVQGGGEVFLAADFSELHAFLLPGDLDPDVLNLGFHEPEEESDASQYQVSLNHLFRSKQRKVLVLPTHSYEMWQFARWHRNLLEEARSLQSTAQEVVDSMSPEQLTALQRFSQDGTLSTAEAESLVAFVRGGFLDFCAGVERVVRDLRRPEMLADLKSMLDEKRIVLSPRDAMSESILEWPSEDWGTKLEDLVFTTLLAETGKGANRFAKLNDARALLTLRDANWALRSSRRRLVLVTRDRGIRKTAERLANSPEFGWPEAGAYVRDLGTVFLDLLLRSESSIDSKLSIIRRYAQLTIELQRSVDFMTGLSTDARRRHPLLRQLGERLLASTERRFAEAVNLDLAAAVAETPWVQLVFAQLPGSTAGPLSKAQTRLVQDAGLSQDDLRVLRSLGSVWCFINSDPFKKLAQLDARAIWADLLESGMRVVFVRALGEVSAEKIQGLVAEKTAGDQTRLYPGGDEYGTSLTFSSAEYQARLVDLTGRKTDTDGKRIERARSALKEAAAESLEGDLPEAYLFMGFVLAWMGLWGDAASMCRFAAERAAMRGEHRVQAECEFMLSVATRKAAVNESADDVLARLRDAYAHASKAERLGREFGAGGGLLDKYLKERATVVLKACELQRLRSHDRASLSAIVSAFDGNLTFDQLGEMLTNVSRGASADPRLRMEALNNLAMIAIWSGGEALTEAEKHASAITHLWKKEIAAETVPLPAPIEHTVLVMLAERAIGVGDRAEVERVEKALRDLTSRVRGGDREVVSADAERLRLWLRA